MADKTPEYLSRIGEYTTSGETVNASLITGLNDPWGIVIAVPEPSTIALVVVALALLGSRQLPQRTRRVIE
jgi:hypothetical protein